MRKRRGLVIIMLTAALLLFGLTGCGDNLSDNSGSSSDNGGYEHISAESAKQLMDTQKGYVILDVRTEEEFAEGHIKNAILIPDYEIEQRAQKELPEKEQMILVYCRSGRRSKNAAQTLAKLGYTNVKEFGGIIDWQYETVK